MSTSNGENAHPNRSRSVISSGAFGKSNEKSLFRLPPIENKAKATHSLAPRATLVDATEPATSLDPSITAATACEAQPQQCLTTSLNDYNNSESIGSSNSNPRGNITRTGRPFGILRDGERMESLFGLNNSSTSEYRQLCRTVTDLATRYPSLENRSTQSSLPEIVAWRRILEICSNTSSTLEKSNGGNVDLLRLHRRATARLAPFLSMEATLPTTNEGQGGSGSEIETTQLRDHMLHIWLSFASAQYNHGKVDEARWTLRNLYTLNLGRQCADFYLAQANVAENDAAALDILQKGLKHQAQPTGDLYRALQKLGAIQQQLHQQQQPSTAATSMSQLSTSSSLPLAKRHRRAFAELETISTASKASVDHEISIKPVLHNESDMSEATIRYVETRGHNMSSQTDATKPSVRFNLPPRIAGSTSKLAHDKFELPSLGGSSLSGRPKQLEVTAKASTETNEKIAIPDNPILRKQGTRVPNVNTISRFESQTGLSDRFLPPAPPKNPTPSTDDAPQAISKVSPPTDQHLLERSPAAVPLATQSIVSTSQSSVAKDGQSVSRRPPLQLKSFRLGKAERVDPSTIKPETEDVTAATPPTAKKDTDKTPTRNPLNLKWNCDYMWDWDFAERQKRSSSEAPIGHTTTASSLSSSSVNVSAVSSTSSSSKEPNGSGSSNAEMLSCRTEINIQVSQPNDAAADLTPKPTRSKMNAPVQPKADADSSALPSINAEFLPLVREQNMLRVNGVPYAKLKIIGKGGSCKVYSALSAGMDTVAIKRVKLEDLDDKAIAGYSNEIALLKRLQGNPSIIQLHDSEVDYERQAILLVMELGEVDLNHILQKQQTSRGLNMNFIRLTWQQMLIAVHSIHEERIIHGDLKPANFLFVRGSLKLIDFGIAKAIQNDDTTNIYRENQIGTLNYMSPEAILDSGDGANGHSMKCGRPSDIWSLGCILYQMIYGKTPFADLQAIGKLHAIVNPKHEIKYPAGFDAAAIDAIKRCLQRNPSDRSPIVHDEVGLLNAHIFLKSNDGT